MLRTQLQRYRNAFAASLIGLAVASTDAAAGWTQIVDPDSTDTATNPGYPGGQSSTAVGVYLKDLLNLANAPTWRNEDVALGTGLAGIGNPTGGDTFLLGLHFGNGVDYWSHTGPYDVFFSCGSDCNTFSLPNAMAIGNYRLYSVLGNPVERVQTTAAIPEPATIAMLGLAFAAIFAVRRRGAAAGSSANAARRRNGYDEVAPLNVSVDAIVSVDRAR